MVLRDKTVPNLLAVLMLSLYCPVQAMASESCEPHRKMVKMVHSRFDDGHVIAPHIFSESGSESLDYLYPGDCVFSISKEGQIRGYLLSTSAKGRFDYFDYSVIYSPDLKVLDVVVTAYRSTQGAGICQKKWLRQFEGYQGEEMEIGKEIDAVSGSTVSATSLVKDLQRCHLLMSHSQDIP